MAVTANKPRPCRTGPVRRRAATLAGAFSVWMAMAFTPTAYGVDWLFEPTLEGSAILTDNANQSDSDPKDSLILRAMPGFTLRSEGSRRLQATLQYGLSGVARFGDNDSTDLLHNLNALGKAELVEDFLFIEGSAHVSQELISLEGPLTSAEISDTNRSTVGSYMVSPYIQKRLGIYADAYARYTASGAIFQNDVAANSTVNALTAALTSGTHFADLSWGLHYSIRNAEYDNDNTPDTTFERAYVSLGYALTRKFRVFGTAGEEWNDYPSPTPNDGSSWSAGFGWTPSRRTSIEASAGERFFGSTYSLTAQHRTRASNWHVNYAEDLSDTTQFLSTMGTVYDYVCRGPDGSVLGYSGWPYSFPPAPNCIAVGGIPGLVFDLRSGVFVSKSLRAGVNWGTGKLTYSLEASDSRRIYQIVNAEDRYQDVTATLYYRVAPYTRVTGSLGMSRYRTPAALSRGGLDRNDDISKLTLGVDHQFDLDLSGGLIYQHQQRDSNIAAGDFTENRITGTVSMKF